MKNWTRRPIRVAVLAIVVGAAAIATVSCGGSGGSGGAPTAPTPSPTPTPTPAPSGANVTVSIVGTSGSGAFSPNPAAATVGQTLAFRNNDTTLHRIVSNSGGYDSGNIAPGATGATMTVSSGTAQNFHCTVHPTMVFAVNGSAPPPDPTPNPSGGYDY